MEQLVYTKLAQVKTHQLEKLVPKKFERKTGQIIKLLANHHSGLSREEIHIFFYEKLHTASWTRRESLKMSVEKIIQRSRIKFQPYNLTIIYDKKTKRYYLDTYH